MGMAAINSRSDGRGGPVFYVLEISLRHGKRMGVPARAGGLSGYSSAGRIFNLGFLGRDRIGVPLVAYKKLLFG